MGFSVTLTALCQTRGRRNQFQRLAVLCLSVCLSVMCQGNCRLRKEPLLWPVVRRDYLVSSSQCRVKGQNCGLQGKTLNRLQVRNVSRPQVRIVSRLLDKTVNRPQVRIVSRLLDKTVNRSQVRIVSRLLDKTVNRLLDKTVSRPRVRIVNRLLDKTVNRRQVRIVSRLLDKTVSRPRVRIVNRLLDKTVSRPQVRIVSRLQANTTCEYFEHMSSSDTWAGHQPIKAADKHNINIGPGCCLPV